MSTTWGPVYANAASSASIISIPAWATQTVGAFCFGSQSAGVSYNAGVRFVNVTIPPGSTIVSATFEANSNAQSGTVCNTSIYGEKSITPAVFSTYTNFEARTKTTAVVPWAAIAAFGNNEWHSAPDLSAIVTEIIGLASWVSGDNIVLMFPDNGSSAAALRDFCCYNQYAPAAPRLTIVYNAPTTTHFLPGIMRTQIIGLTGGISCG